MMQTKKKQKKGAMNMALTYTKQGDYLIPDLIPPESPQLGKYGMLRRSFLQDHRKGIYTGMLLKGTLNSHLEETDRQANEMMETLISRMAQTEGVTESLKASNQMEWVRQMNSIHRRAEEQVLNDLIYS